MQRNQMTRKEFIVLTFTLVGAGATAAGCSSDNNNGGAAGSNGNAGSNPLRVTVTAQQFAWQFEYTNGPADGRTEPTLRLPLGRPVELSLHAKDVIHSFWVPQFGQKMDALPDTEEFPHPTRLVITPTKLGTFPIICTELCGLGHSLMRSSAIVMRPGEFNSWARSAAS